VLAFASVTEPESGFGIKIACGVCTNPLFREAAWLSPDSIRKDCGCGTDRRLLCGLGLRKLGRRPQKWRVNGQAMNRGVLGCLAAEALPAQIMIGTRIWRAPASRAELKLVSADRWWRPQMFQSPLR
jgi:hypothetical protein